MPVVLSTLCCLLRLVPGNQQLHVLKSGPEHGGLGRVGLKCVSERRQV